MMKGTGRDKVKGSKGRLLVGWWKRTFGLIAVLGLLVGTIAAQVNSPEQERLLERRDRRERLLERMNGRRSPNASFALP
jgi:hypothetical protein